MTGTLGFCDALLTPGSARHHVEPCAWAPRVQVIFWFMCLYSELEVQAKPLPFPEAPGPLVLGRNRQPRFPTFQGRPFLKTLTASSASRVSVILFDFPNFIFWGARIWVVTSISSFLVSYADQSDHFLGQSCILRLWATWVGRQSLESPHCSLTVAWTSLV